MFCMLYGLCMNKCVFLLLSKTLFTDKYMYSLLQSDVTYVCGLLEPSEVMILQYAQSNSNRITVGGMVLRKKSLTASITDI